MIVHFHGQWRSASRKSLFPRSLSAPIGPQRAEASRRASPAPTEMVSDPYRAALSSGKAAPSPLRAAFQLELSCPGDIRCSDAAHCRNDHWSSRPASSKAQVPGNATSTLPTQQVRGDIGIEGVDNRIISNCCAKPIVADHEIPGRWHAGVALCPKLQSFTVCRKVSREISKRFYFLGRSSAACVIATPPMLCPTRITGSGCALTTRATASE